MKLDDDRTDDEILDFLSHAEIVRARLVALAEANNGAAELRSVWGTGAAAVTRDPCKPTQWRHSRFDEYGAAGHMEAATLADAIAHAYEDGFREWAPGAIAEAFKP